ncbi:MAG: hypothetical protein ACT4OP_04490 [Actinomycetota bacterium]
MKRRWVGVAMALATLVVIGYGATLSAPVIWFVDVMAILALLSPAIVGAYLIWRLPANPVGLLLSAFAFTFAVGIVGETAAATGSPLAAWGAWLGSWQWAVGMALILVFLPLLFPDGKLPSPRYRRVLPVTWIGLAMIVSGEAFRPSAEIPTAGVTITVDLPLPLPIPPIVLDVMAAVGLALMLSAVASGLVGAVWRFRRSKGIERQQMKVFASALVAAVTGMALNVILYQLDLTNVANALFATLVVILISSIGVAVLRYRLYDLDLVIRRTIAYALATMVLIAVYAGATLLLGTLLGRHNPLGVATSTLAVAGLFNPVRRFVQTAVDRRFDRAHFDATRVIDSFSARLRGDADLDGLTVDLAGVVGATLRPAKVSVWLRK